MTILDELFSGDDQRAEAALPQVGEAHLPELEAALGAREADRRWWAARALSQVPGERALRALLRAAADPEGEVRAAALHGLGQRPEPEAVGALVAVLAEPSEFLARVATDALIAIDSAAVPNLLAVLAHDARPRARANAARALAAIRDQASIQALLAALEDDSVLVQYWAEEGLERMGVGQVYFKPGG